MHTPVIMTFFGLGGAELILISLICGAIGAYMGHNRNRLPLGLILGLLLGVLGLIILLFVPKDTSRREGDNLDALKKLSELRKEGAITDEEFERKKKEYLN